MDRLMTLDRRPCGTALFVEIQVASRGIDHFLRQEYCTVVNAVVTSFRRSSPWIDMYTPSWLHSFQISKIFLNALHLLLRKLAGSHQAVDVSIVLITMCWMHPAGAQKLIHPLSQGSEWRRSNSQPCGNILRFIFFRNWCVTDNGQLSITILSDIGMFSVQTIHLSPGRWSGSLCLSWVPLAMGGFRCWFRWAVNEWKVGWRATRWANSAWWRCASPCGMKALITASGWRRSVPAGWTPPWPCRWAPYLRNRWRSQGISPVWWDVF